MIARLYLSSADMNKRDPPPLSPQKSLDLQSAGSSVFISATYYQSSLDIQTIVS